MADSPALSVNQLLVLAQGLTRRQQISIAVGAAVVAATLWVFVKMINKDDYRPLYSGLAPEETQSIARRLEEKGIAYQLSSDGKSVRVPPGQLDRVRLGLAAKGFPQSGRLGFELFDKPNWAGSDFAEKVNYQRALEGELERTIQSLSEIEAARVHLVLLHESVFTERERPAKASVVVKLRGGRMAEESLEAITHLVASAVDSMPPENVTVVDVNGHVPLLARRNGPGKGLGRADLLEASLAEKIVSVLTPVVGADRVKANVTVEYEIGTTESTQETYDPASAVVLTSQVSEERSGEPVPQGIPGTASNVPGKQQTSGAAAAAEELSEAQSQKTESKTYAISKAVRRVAMPPGGIKRLTASVLVDDAVEGKEENGKTAETRRKRTPEEMKQIQEVAAATIGIDAARGDRLAVENLSFLPMTVEAPPPPQGLERWAPLAERYVWLVRYLALMALFGVVYGLVLRPVKKQIIQALRQVAARLAKEKLMPAELSVGKPPIPGTAGMPELEASLPDDLAEAHAEVKQAVILKRHLVDKVNKEPEAASRLIQNWVRQAEARR